MGANSRNKAFIKTYGPLAIVLMLVLLALPRDTKFPYEYKVGQEWKSETLYALFDFPIYKSADQIWTERSQIEKSATPYYKYSDEVSTTSISKIEALDLDSLSRVVSYSIRAIYEKGIISDNEIDNSSVIYIQRHKHAFKSPVTEVYTLKQAREKLHNDLSQYYQINLDSLLAVKQVYTLLEPNLIFDAQTTELVKADAQNEFSPTSGFISSGDHIISQGEIVTAEIANTLDSYRREYESNIAYIDNPWLIWLSNLCIALLFVVLLYLAIYTFCPTVFSDKSYLYVLLVVTVFVIATLMLLEGSELYLCLVPYTLVVLILQAFLKPREYLPIYFLVLLPILIYAQKGPELFIMFASAGVVQALVFKYFRKGWRQFVAALITFTTLAAIFLIFKFAKLIAEPIGEVLLRLFMGSLLTVAAYPLVYLLEKLFNIVSNSRLEELSDTSSSIIRQLEQKAPGTFQHSLQLMNMADAVSRAINVNPELVRVGALYHDIGKMLNPLCFVENEFMLSSLDVAKYHSDLSPEHSARDIINHVNDGVELARKEHLPQVVIDFILTHHGTTRVRFFYDKFIKEGGDLAQAEVFSYQGKKPHTKAQVILMICDSIEAASRTLKNNTAKAYSDFVESIVASKMAEDQFDDADISLRELNIIKDTLKQYLAQINHERIVYPKSKVVKK